MNKQYLSAVDMLKIAAEHAYCAEYLLKQNAEVHLDKHLSIDALLPIISLIHLAFELTLKACLLHEHRQIRHYKNLMELVELNHHLGLSKEDLKLITTLSRQQAFRKGTDYMLWENRQQLHAFCEQTMRFYARLQELMPLELQVDYQ
ncbi:hypothetical protein [Legionella nagasakiensis]|uniref:hypothetical protein n=1 Tax=Legionella nagasakiensis TaxID=535290 RepID=UPI001056271B|nr:hypothetical protein [Legionella nagasakiensis]